MNQPIPGLNILIRGLIAIGLCSAIHHAKCDTHNHLTIWIDWFPIAVTGLLLLFRYPSLLRKVSWLTASMWTGSLALLMSDHVYTPFPVPWGHVVWHVAAAASAHKMYLDMMA